MKVISIANQKGGVGKTTSTLAMGSMLAERGRRVLIVDLDPQGSLTESLGIECVGRSMAEVIGLVDPGPLTIPGIAQKISEGLSLAPSDLALASCELALIARLGREIALRNALRLAAPLYDLALIDCPPSLGLLTVNALVASDGVITPTLPAAADLRGLRLFLSTLDKVKQLNPGLQLVGILITQFDGRLNSHNQALDTLQSAGLPILFPAVPRSVRVQEAAGVKQSLTVYDPKGKPAEAYRQITSEVEKWLDKNKI
jgi:chromosome partitioning protein